MLSKLFITQLHFLQNLFHDKNKFT